MAGALERENYLERLSGALTHSDWLPLAYALMSSHVHWTGLAGSDPSSSFVKPLHCGFAGWLNRAQKRVGPVFADRHRSIIIERERVAELVAYIHNNPVRAGVVADPAESTWTSHRYYLGVAVAPAWLDVARGLSLCGFDASPSGRRAFHEFVLKRRAEPRSPMWGIAAMNDHRSRIRERLGSAVEASWPVVVGDQVQHALVTPSGALIRNGWEGSADEVIRFVTARLGSSP